MLPVCDVTLTCSVAAAAQVSWERWSPAAQLAALADQVTAELVQLTEAASSAQAQLASRLTGQLRALSLLYHAVPPPPPPPPPALLTALQQAASKLDLPAATPPPAPHEPGPAAHEAAPLTTSTSERTGEFAGVSDAQRLL